MSLSGGDAGRDAQLDPALERWRVRADGFVPKQRYTRAEFADLEHERLWPRTWQVVGREEELSEPGEHLTYEIGDESVLVLRDDAGAIRAFHNSCLHRGTRLASGNGCFDTGSIRCRYHAWTYSLRGALTHVPDREEFELDSQLGLRPVRCESWGGFVFVCFDATAEPLVDYLAPIPELLGPYHLEQMRLRAALTTVLPANWKAVVDAFNEGYHVQGTHPQILRWTDDTSIAYETLGRHARYGRLPGARRALAPSPRLGLSADEVDEGAILAGLVEGLGGAFLGEERELVAQVRSLGLPRGELLGEYQRRRRALLTERGLDTSALADEAMTSAEDFFWFPNLVGPIYPGSAIFFRTRPVGRDPSRCIHDTWVLEWRPADTPRRPARRVAVEDWREHDWGEITNQDYANMAEVTAGMRSSAFDGLRLSRHQERILLAMHRTIDRYCFGDPADLGTSDLQA